MPVALPPPHSATERLSRLVVLSGRHRDSLAARPWPGRCACCRQWTGWKASVDRLPTLCQECQVRFVPHHPPEGSAGRCPFCAQWLPALGGACDCAGGLLPVQRSWDAAYAGVDYAHPWIDLIHDFKFRGRVERADLLARLAHRALPESLKFNRVIPIPLSPQRLSERGYNQAWELARRIARWLPRSGGAWHDVLMRRQSLTPQAGLSREERWRSLQGAMVVNPDHGAAIRGAHVLLVDDVMTTGATFQAAALALRAAGAAQIDVLAVARTP